MEINWQLKKSWFKLFSDISSLWSLYSVLMAKMNPPKPHHDRHKACDVTEPVYENITVRVPPSWKKKPSSPLARMNYMLFSVSVKYLMITE